VTRWAWPAAWLLVAALATLGVGRADAPSVAPTAAELLPPGTRVAEVDLRDGGFVRATRLTIEGGAIVAEGPSSSRALPALTTSGPIRTIVMWLGTDHQGRDVLARLVAGARRSLAVAAGAMTVAAILGVGVGLAAAFAPRRLEGGITLIVDAALSLPRLLLILILGVVFRATWSGAAWAIGCASWMEIARLVEADARSVARRPFALAARAAGAGPGRIATTHVLPHLVPVLGSLLPAAATEAILLESTLSFLGVGGADTASWGGMVADGLRLMPGAWWMSVAPGVLLVVTAVSMSLLARGRSPVAPSV
jgi:peptide/nickel transport system permease protein